MSFPVVDDKGFCGVINRIDLTNLLQYPEVFRKRTDPPPDELIKYHSIHTDKDRFDIFLINPNVYDPYNPWTI